MEMLKKVLMALAVPLVVVLANEHGFLEVIGGKTKKQAETDHPPK